jgi:hypothetical protein
VHRVLLQRAEPELHGRHGGDVRQCRLHGSVSRHVERPPVVHGHPRRPIRRVRGRRRREQRPLHAPRRAADRAARTGPPDHDLLHSVMG